jgi:hypothetical protein
MNARSRCLAALAAAVVGVGLARGADELPKRAGPFVVIVGAGEFTDRAISPRPTADADAKALFDLLIDPRYLGVRADRATLLLSAPDEKRRARTATRDAIIKSRFRPTSTCANGRVRTKGTCFGRVRTSRCRRGSSSRPSTAAGRGKRMVGAHPGAAGEEGRRGGVTSPSCG